MSERAYREGYGDAVSDTCRALDRIEWQLSGAAAEAEEAAWQASETRKHPGGCMRDQRTTQYCAEAVEAKARIAELERERDEAREATAKLHRRTQRAESKLARHRRPLREWVEVYLARLRVYRDESATLRAERDRLREALDEALANQRCDAPGWFTWWTAWVIRAAALRGEEG